MLHSPILPFIVTFYRFIGQMLASRLSSHRTINEVLVTITEGRLREKALRKEIDNVEKHVSKFSGK